MMILSDDFSLCSFSRSSLSCQFSFLLRKQKIRERNSLYHLFPYFFSRLYVCLSINDDFVLMIIINCVMVLMFSFCLVVFFLLLYIYILLKIYDLYIERRISLEVFERWS